MADDAPMVLYWYYRHHVLSVERCESVEEAARASWRDARNEDAAVDAVEVVEGGESRTENVLALWKAFDDEEEASYEARAQEPIIATTQLRALTPNAQGHERWATLDWYTDVAVGAEKHAGYVARFGHRVRYEKQ